MPALQRLLRPAPLLLIRDGRMQKRNMQCEKGVDVVEDVKQCYLEGSDRISVIQWGSK
jgi:uncharacterized membrane protein YcaP (DUF421 family)